MRLLDREELLDLVEMIAGDEFCADITDIASQELFNLSPPEKISTVECAEQYRYLRSPEGSNLVRYDRWRNPYNVGPMNSLDDPKCNLVVIVKPSRSGGTTIAENFLFKMMKFGPMGRVGWYLGSDDAVKKYCDSIVKPMFEDHSDLRARVGEGRSDNNETSKKVSGHLIEWLAASDNNFRNREFIFGVADEPDGWKKKFASGVVEELKGRQKQLGQRAKRIVMSHPDMGWAAGTASAWETTSRGIYIMRCVECSGYASAHSTKFWPDIPEFKLSYQRCPDEHQDKRISMAKETAGMACPHCGAVLTDEQRFAMIDEASIRDKYAGWMHRGMSFSPEEGPSGEMEETTDHGYWCHGLMLKVSPASELASDLEAALIKFERSGSKKTDKLRTLYSKLLGEIFEGAASIGGATSASLQQRAKAEAAPSIGMCPPEVKFITAAVDVGIGKFDVSFRGWDLEARSWWIDRYTIKHRTWPDGIDRDIRTRERIEDWWVLIDKVLTRKFPIMGLEGWAMPVAVMTVDVGDGNVTWKGREFARRALMAGHYWGRAAKPWAKVRLVQGSPNARAPELPIVPNKISKDEEGRPVAPVISEYTLGVHKLKELAVERLGIDDDAPGQCYFASGIGSNFFDEYFNERLIEGKWERNGPNESLDLFAYEEAGRLMLQPDRKDLKWSADALPPWAKPVRINDEIGSEVSLSDEPSEAGAALSYPVSQPPKKRSVLDRFGALNNDPTPENY